MKKSSNSLTYVRIEVEKRTVKSNFTRRGEMVLTFANQLICNISGENGEIEYVQPRLVLEPHEDNLTRTFN